jgi:hypothetical protein
MLVIIALGMFWSFSSPSGIDIDQRPSSVAGALSGHHLKKAVFMDKSLNFQFKKQLLAQRLSLLQQIAEQRKRQAT